MADLVVQHYGSSGIAARILDAVRSAGGDVDKLSPEALFPYDQLHARELQATEDHVAWLKPADGEHVIDVGCGIGGPARFIAAKTSAHVTGIDLTAEFIEAAGDLTSRCGLSDRVTFQQGDALDMPVESRQFDAAVCLYVAMNVADKTGLAREIARVLKPGGRLIWSEAVGVPGRSPTYPLPWARTAEGSHLTTSSDLRLSLEAGGLKTLDWRDETQLIIEHASAARRIGQSRSPERRMANEVVLGADFMERRRNFIAGMESGNLMGVAVLATV
ncbi:MAG: methyltransferase domain-containing protein [Azospirillaceae bacterium]